MIASIFGFVILSIFLVNCNNDNLQNVANVSCVSVEPSEESYINYDVIYKDLAKIKEEKEKKYKKEESSVPTNLPKYTGKKYNTSRFKNAEDFYDHYYDDFIDYYEAEKYYNRNK